MQHAVTDLTVTAMLCKKMRIEELKEGRTHDTITHELTQAQLGVLFFLRSVNIKDEVAQI